ncbi:MAG: hypothetical protein WCF16_03720 [Alphaproteobacteria bacterium]
MSTPIWIDIRAVTLAAACALAAMAGTALAADAAKETATAAQHVGFAAAATVVNTVHEHLHHAVNCLVGPNGEGYDAKAADPCKGMGTGAIPDTADAAKKKALESALASAKQGLAANDLAAAKKSAAAAEAALKQAM